MAIEPLGSIMSVQAQPVNTPKPAVEVEKPTTTENSTVQAPEKVDKTTVVVDNAQEKGQGNNAGLTEQEQPSQEQLKKAVEQMRKNMNNSEAVFGIHEGTNRVTIKIIDKKTKDVIKELPPEKTLDMIAKAWELAGILVDEKR